MILRADARNIPLADESVQCVVSSPPYWGLRSYGIGTENGEIGLEPTPEAYVETMVAVFREVKRVLRKDGTLWLNLGDSYAGSGRGGDKEGNEGKQTTNGGSSTIRDMKMALAGLKPKDLCGIPWRVAFALQADGWYLRSDIIWSKPNPMPESVTDRPTRAHEYVFLLAKSERYFYDADAVREPLIGEIHKPGNVLHVDKIAGPNDRNGHSQWEDTQVRAWGNEAGRNKRSVWTVNSEATGGLDDFDAADYVAESGKPYKASPSCPIHAPLANRRTQQMAECDEQLSIAALRSLDNDCRLAFVRQLAPASMSLPNNGATHADSASQRTPGSSEPNRTLAAPGPCGEDDLADDERTPFHTNRNSSSIEMLGDSSDSSDLGCAETANASSNGTRKTPLARTETARGIACVETDDGTARIRPRPFESAPNHGNGENRTLWDDLPVHRAAQTNARIADNPSFLNDTCKCSLSQQAHFATFPQKLIEPCILAGTSEKGCCAECGAPRVRVTEDSPEYAATKARLLAQRGGMRSSDLESLGLTRGKSNPSITAERTTTGWQPSCVHDAPSVPCVVFDPFFGSGTVGKVAERFGRRWVGLELSESYIEIAKNRTAQMGMAL